MDAGIKTRWVQKLRSGEAEQGRNWLSNQGKKCCLGLLCDLAVDAGIAVATYPNGEDEAAWYAAKNDPADSSPSSLPRAVMAWAGLPESDGFALGEIGGPEVWIPDEMLGLSGMNDVRCSPFPEIADVIEKYL